MEGHVWRIDDAGKEYLISLLPVKGTREKFTFLLGGSPGLRQALMIQFPVFEVFPSCVVQKMTSMARSAIFEGGRLIEYGQN
jgi:hypothetical protein